MKLSNNSMMKPPKTWKEPEDHHKYAISDYWYNVIAKIQDEINFSTFQFFRNQNIRSVQLPITTGSVTSPMGLGSDSLPVKINLEGVETYLADSMQFHLEYMLRQFNDGVHYIMPTFRGEKADARHLCQFYHSEAEIPGDLNDVITLVNNYINSLCKDLLNNLHDEILEIAGTTEHIKSVIQKGTDIPRITLEEAIDVLDNDPTFIEIHAEGFREITHKGEQKLIEIFGGIVWLTHFDYLSVPFYQAYDSSESYALNGDLLFGIGEVVGAGERHKDVNHVKHAMEKLNVKEEQYKWYLHMKNHHPIKTSGFGMGVERFILWLIKHSDIRDCQVIPRFNGIQMTP